MSLIYIEGFEGWNLGSTAHLSAMGWSAIAISTITGRYGGSGASVASGTRTWAFPSNYATIYVGIAVYLDSAGGTLYSVMDGSTVQVDLRITVNRQIQITRNGTQLEITDNNIFVDGWHYIELGTTINNSGSWEVKLDGVTILSGSGDTQQSTNAYVNILSLGAGGSGFDDLYIDDSQFHGDCIVTTTFANANGTNRDWTLSTGTDDFAVLDETTPNDDTDYAYSVTADQIITVGMQDHTAIGNIIGIEIDVYAKKADAGVARTIQIATRTNSNNYFGDNITLGNSYAYYRKIYETNPNTSSAWSDAEMDAIEVGAKLIS